MIELVFIVCLAMSADDCAERRLVQPETGVTGCMVAAQAQLAGWSEEHPGYRVVRWSCRWTHPSSADA
jgi:hypothetical protein